MEPITKSQIINWAKAHFALTGNWPSSGLRLGPTGHRWAAINQALVLGHRGLPGGDSLSRLLKGDKRPLSVQLILQWADEHKRLTGTWPISASGRVLGFPAETWARINEALRVQKRGLRDKTTLARLLLRFRGVDTRRRRKYPPLTIEQILQWADDYRKRTGGWPMSRSGLVAGQRQTWAAVDVALACGSRGLPGGTTLCRLLAKHRGAIRQWTKRTPRHNKGRVEAIDARKRRKQK